MDLKEKIALIKSEIKKETPSVDKNYILKTARIESSAKTSAYSLYSSKRFVLRTVFSFVIIFILAVIIFPNSIKTNFMENADKSTDESNYVGSYSKYAFATTSLVSLFANNKDLLENESTLPLSTGEIDRHLDYLNRYINALEIFFKDSQISNTHGVGDYRYKSVYTTKNLLNETISFEIFYNESNNNGRFTHLVVYNNQNYYVEGIENETSFSLTIFLNPSSYMKVVKNDDAYDYRITKNFQLINYSRLTVLDSQNEVSLQLENLRNPMSVPVFTISKNINQIGALNINYQIYSLITATPNETHTDQYQSDYTNKVAIDSGLINAEIVKNDNDSFFSYSYNSNIVVKDRMD